MKKNTYIYGLYDPRELVDGEIENIRYVGKSDHPLDRLKDHVKNSRQGSEYPVHDWIRKLLSNGTTPEVMILAEPPMDSHEGVEQHIIDVIREEGHDLMNVGDGGEGFTSEEVKRMWADPAVRERVSVALKRYWQNPEARAKKSASMKRRYKDPAVRAKTGAAIKRHHKDHPETRERMSAIQKHIGEDPVERERRSARMKHCYEDPASRVRRSVGVKRHYEENPTARARVSAVTKRAWADPHHRARRRIRHLRRKVVKSMEHRRA